MMFLKMVDDASLVHVELLVILLSNAVVLNWGARLLRGVSINCQGTRKRMSPSTWNVLSISGSWNKTIT